MRFSQPENSQNFKLLEFVLDIALESYPKRNLS